MSWFNSFNRSTHRGLRAAAAAFALCGAGTAWGQDTVSVGTVSRLAVHAGDVIIFSIAGPRTNSPACATAGVERALSLTSPTGRAMYAMLLTAAAQNRAVRVHGWGPCLGWTQRAEAGWMQFES
jgi:hypothetical protein